MVKLLKTVVASFLDWEYGERYHGFSHKRTNIFTGEVQTRSTPAHPWIREYG